jgi:8-oxo-dGTP pyrophosphatase MutT (NUDIX family)
VSGGLFAGDAGDPSPLIPAATVLLLRERDGAVEVLMLRKNRGQAFGGMWVFPGGRVEDGDGPAGAGEEVVARHAAEREALEETGLVLDDAELVPFSHWVPPPETPKRFSTWFFVAALPGGLTDVVIDGGEIGDHVWTTPATALERHRAGETELAPPTWVTLHDLAGHGSVDAVLAAARSRSMPRYATRVAHHEGALLTLWEPDAAYDTAPAGLDAPGPRHRLHMRDGGWELEVSEPS